jgi:hypothetical protein
MTKKKKAAKALHHFHKIERIYRWLLSNMIIFLVCKNVYVGNQHGNGHHLLNIIYYILVLKLISLKQRDMIEKTYMMSFVVAVSSVLLASLAVISYIPGPASAQIVPSTSMPDSSANPQSSVLPKSLQPADSGIESMPHLASVQNSTTTNITQLATVLPTVPDQPITPSSIVPISEDSDDSDDSRNDSDENNSSDDGDENNSGSNDDSGDDDSGDDDSDNNDDGDGDEGGSVAVAGGGGAFAFAG